MQKDTQITVVCNLAIIAALLVVGVVSHIVLRHIVQTSVLWIAIVLGIRNSKLTKWAALPCFVFWLVLMAAIWTFLLGWNTFLSGTFSPTEIAMTIIVGVASLAGIVGAVPIKGSGRGALAFLTILVVLTLQVAAFRLSMLPQIAHR